MSVKAFPLAVQTPIPQKKLGRYRNLKGFYLIRLNGSVVYIGHAETDLYKSVMRMFQKGRKLSHLDYNRVQIEIILSNLKTARVKSVLLQHYKPIYNKDCKPPKKSTEYQRRRDRKIKQHYLEQTSFVETEHKTDSEPLNSKR